MEHMLDPRISNTFHRGVTEPSSKNTQADDISVLVEEGSGEIFIGTMVWTVVIPLSYSHKYNDNTINCGDNTINSGDNGY